MDDSMLLPDEPCVFIKIPQSFESAMTASEIYECVRKWWKLNPARARRCHYAIGVLRGCVIGVYEIDGWIPAGSPEIAENPKNEGRWGFHGRPAEEMGAKLLGLSVSETVNGQNPIRYWRA